MQIRLTVLAPPSGQNPARACDVLVTAPAGTALAAVASGLATAVCGPEGSQGGARTVSRICIAVSGPFCVMPGRGTAL